MSKITYKCVNFVLTGRRLECWTNPVLVPVEGKQEKQEVGHYILGTFPFDPLKFHPAPKAYLEAGELREIAEFLEQIAAGWGEMHGPSERQFRGRAEEMAAGRWPLTKSMEDWEKPLKDAMAGSHPEDLKKVLSETGAPTASLEDLMALPSENRARALNMLYHLKAHPCSTGLGEMIYVRLAE